VNRYNNAAGAICRTALRYLVRATNNLAVVIFVLAIPTFLVTSNVRLAFDSLSLYRYGFERYDVVQTTGLDIGQLMVVAQDIRDYFYSSQDLLDVKIYIGLEQRNLFNQGEILHMKDVKKLVMLVHRVQELTMVYMAFYVALALLITKGRSADVVLGRVMKGSLVTVAIFVLAGLASLVGFDQIFNQFHVISFTSGTYTFDPRYNYLTRLFTEGFFMQATLFIAISVVVQAALLALIAWAFRKLVFNIGLRLQAA